MPTKRLLFVVHRYYPYPGGSEYNVKRLAEAAVAKGHSVTVLTDVHQGDQNGVIVTSDRRIAIEQLWDMIIVHGCCPTQDFIHANADIISKKSPIYYLIVQPTDSAISQQGMKYAKWIGCGTTFDIDHVVKYGHLDKVRPFRYGIDLTMLGTEGFRVDAGITTPYMFLSAGGFWAHKGMDELVEAFKQANRPDVTLVLLGYDTQHHQPPVSEGNVVSFLCGDQQMVMNALLESDLYIMNSTSEGYGLMILEAMYHGVPWLARDIAAAYDLANRGKVYTMFDELVAHLSSWVPPTPEIYSELIMPNATYVANEHSAEVSLMDILAVLDE